MGKYVPITMGTIEPLAWNPEIRTGKLALVCEGGGQRGIFTAGVLDEFLKADFNPFDITLGTSAGAQNLSAYICGQHGYARRVITRYTTDKLFFDPVRFVRGGHLLDLDWLVDITAKEFPLDINKALEQMSAGHEFYMCACRSDNFKPHYFQPTQMDWLQKLKASSAIPGFYRNGVDIDGVIYHDGGISDAIPVEEAYRRGAKRIVVIRTVPSQLYYTPEWMKRMERLLQNSSLQRMVQMLKQHAKSYYRTQKFIENPPKDVEIFEIYPPSSLKSSALGSSIGALNQDYHLGRRCGRYFLASVAEKWVKHPLIKTEITQHTYPIPPISEPVSTELPIAETIKETIKETVKETAKETATHQ